MAKFILPDLKISDESRTADIEALIKVIKPSWNSNELKIEILHGGGAGHMIKCYDANAPGDSVTIRIRRCFDALSKKKIENSLELKIIQYLSVAGHFPEVHAIFGNGYCYQFIEGKTMINGWERTGQVDDVMIRSIAEEMAFIHSIKLEDVDYSEKNTFSFLYKFMTNLDPLKPMTYGLNKKILEKEFHLVTNFLRSKNYQPVQCHGDAHFGNYIWNKEQGKTTFIDWEGAQVGYQLAEIAQQFASTKMLERIFIKDKGNRITEEGYETNFMRYYVKAWKKYENDETEITDEEFTKWMNDLEIFKIAASLVYVIFCVNMTEGMIKFSGDEHIVEGFVQNYLKLKEKLIGKGTFETEQE